MSKSRTVLNLIIFAAIVILITGCASTAPKPEFTNQIAPESLIAVKDDENVKVETGAGVTMLESEKIRLAEKIKLNIDTRKLKNGQDIAPETYEIVLIMKKYEKGNAFARAMLAGIGQIHIDADVEVFQMPERTSVGGFALSKTFAWGGIYGATIGIEDIETTFADGVAAAITGQTE